MHCERASKIWFRSNLGINFDSNQASFADWINYSINTLMGEDINYIAAITYGIWFTHNQQIFEYEDMEVINKAHTNIHGYKHSTHIEHSNQPNNISRRINVQQRASNTTRSTPWSKPEDGIIKINCDANLTRIGRWRLRASCRDADGVLVAAATWETSGTNNPTLAEAYALYKAILLAIDCCFQDVIF
jgi:hypothetical protein